MGLLIEPDTLRAATGCTPQDAARYAEPLSTACLVYDIAAPERLAAFLAQLAHESGGLRHVRELADGTAYEGRQDLGNTQPGDGPRYRGRGLLQITGRANYRRTAERLRTYGAPDFEADPQALEQPQWAAWSAADWWAAHELNQYADRGEYIKIGRAINRGNPHSPRPANGEADREQRWARARAALGCPPWPGAPAAAPPEPAPGQAAGAQENAMPLPIVLLKALLPAAVELLPKLGRIFGSGSEVAERNVRAAQVVLETVKTATGAASEQEALDRVRADPAARQAAEQAIEARWYELTEAGGGGIEAARKADQAAQGGDGPWWAVFKSPSFLFLLLAMPPVYAVVGSIVGLWGGAWPSDVRAAIATAVVSMVLGGAVGYYWGQTTSRNRTQPPAGQA